MKKPIKSFIPAALLVVGLSLITTALFLKSDATPMGSMDCGCGRQTECVTKNRGATIGAALSITGAVFLVAGATGTVFAIRRRKAA